MLEALQRLGDAALIERFIGSVVSKEYDGSENDALIAVTQFLGAAKAATVFAELAARKMPSSARQCVSLLSRLIEAQGSSRIAAWFEAVRSVARALVGGLEKVGDPETTSRQCRHEATLRELVTNNEDR